MHSNEDFSPTNSQPTSPPHVGLVYDERMCLHIPSDSRHNERPARITSIVSQLEENGLMSQCDLVPIFDPEDLDAECEILEGLSVRGLFEICHDPKYVDLVLSGRLDGSPELQQMIDEDADDPDELYDPDLYFSCPGSPTAIRLACLGVVQMVRRVCRANAEVSRLAACIIRPPGHHALRNKAMGYCFLNNAAVAARFARDFLGIDRVAIVDWDIHHGNGTFELVAEDDGILYLSVHRAFYPWTGGLGDRRGKCVHVNFGHDYGDDDMVSVFQEILEPVLREFLPQLVLVSAGFDVAKGDLIGKCEVTSETFGWMTRELMNLPHDPALVVALEGGYALDVTASGFSSCIEALLGREVSAMSFAEGSLKPGTRELLDLTKEIYARDWSCLGDE